MTLLLAPQRWNLTQDRVLVDGEMERVAPQIASVVEHSFSTHPMRNNTTAEHKRRVDFVTKAYFSFRQHGWTELRAVSHLRQVLTAHLNTTVFAPRERTMFVRDPLLFPDAAPAFALIDSARGD
jgi:hypothetical protein